MGDVKVPVSLPETEGKGQEQRAHSQMTDGIIFLYRCAWNVGSCLVFINLTYIDNCCRSVLAIFLLSRAWQPPCHSALWQLKKAVGGQGAWTCFCNQSQPFNKNDHDGYSLTKLLCIRHLTSITAFNLQTSYASSLHGLFFDVVCLFCKWRNWSSERGFFSYWGGQGTADLSLALNIIYRHSAATAPFPPIPLFTSVICPRQGLLWISRELRTLRPEVQTLLCHHGISSSHAMKI